MKGLHLILFFFFALLCACVPTQKPYNSPEEKEATAADNIKVFEEAASQKQVQLQNGKKYALYEKWAPKGREMYECVTGWSHIRLVVGTYEENGDGCNSHFAEPMAYDLGRRGQDKKGGLVQINDAEWRANHYLIGAGEKHWHKSSAESKYEFAGEVKESSSKELVTNKGMQLSHSFVGEWDGIELTL